MNSLLLFVFFVISSVLAVADPGSSALRVILDTDANNEVDDQHAIAYLLLNPEAFAVEAITINGTRNGGDAAKQRIEAERVVALCQRMGDFPIGTGATKDYEEISAALNEPGFDGQEAVDLIIARAHAERTEPLVVVAIGKLTNVALALEKDPTIASRIRVVWLGSSYPQPGEYNLNDDIPAMNRVLDSRVPLEIAVVRYGKDSGTAHVRVSFDEIKRRLLGKGPHVEEGIEGRNGGHFHCFGDYSINLFENTGLHGNPPGRPLFDLAAVAIVKNPSWAQKEMIPAPVMVEGEWVDRPENERMIAMWTYFDREGILNDFFATFEKSPAR
jgi:inosine-uridine nucleoside N-ribohydrolase